MRKLGKALAGLGKIEQIAFVPADYDAALKYWIEAIGAGPFFVAEHITLGPTFYKGTPTTVDISAAFGYWGDIQIELIRQHDDTPSIYNDWLREGRQGVQHLGIIVDDYDEAYARLSNAHGVPLLETSIPGAVRAAYFEMPEEPVPLVELLDVGQEFLDVWAGWRKIATEWDGITDPIRIPA